MLRGLAALARRSARFRPRFLATGDREWPASDVNDGWTWTPPADAPARADVAAADALERERADDASAPDASPFWAWTDPAPARPRGGAAADRGDIAVVVGEPIQVSELTAALRAAGGADVAVIDFSDRADVDWTDAFVLVTARSSAHARALAKLCARALKARRLHASAPGATGYEGSDDVADGWALVDGGNFVLHVLTAPARRALDLERLWGAPGRALADALPADAETLSAEEFERAVDDIIEANPVPDGYDVPLDGRAAAEPAPAAKARAEAPPPGVFDEARLGRELATASPAVWPRRPEPPPRALQPRGRRSWKERNKKRDRIFR